MKCFKAILDFYIKTSLHVGFAVFCLVKITVLSYNSDKHSMFSTCVFFGTIIGYNFLKYFELFKKVGFQIKNYFSIFFVTSLSIIAFMILFFQSENKLQCHLLISGSFVLIYPFLRNYGSLKIFFVSFAVTYITAFIPLIEHDSINFQIFIFKRFLMCICLLLPFEIYDSKSDLQTMNTLPQLFGVKTTKIIGYCLLFFYSFFYFFKSKINIQIYLIEIFVAFIIGTFIYFSNINRSKYYTSFWVESIPVFWWILLLIFC